MIGNLRRQRLARLLFCVALVSAPLAWGDAANPADQVLQRYIDASGGAARLAAVHSRVIESSMKLGWFSVSVKTTLASPDRVLVEATMPIIGKKVSSGYDGTTAWAPSDDGSPRLLQGREFQEFVLHQRLDRTARLLELYPVRRLLPQAAGAAPQVELGTSFGTQELWTFDPATGLLQSTDGLVDSGPKKGIVRIVTRFDDYRTINGLTLPFHATLKDDKSEASLTVTRVSDDVAVAAAAFVPPAGLKTP